MNLVKTRMGCLVPFHPVATIILAMLDSRPSIYDRIILAMRARGRTESERQFCARLGLSQSYLSQLRDRCLKDPGRTIAADVAARIAGELGMTVEELMGSDAQPANEERYPSRSDAVAAARALRYSSAAIDAAYLDDPGWDPGRLWWFRRIEAEESRLGAGAPPSSGLGHQRPRSGQGVRKR
jgi:hypothetical protein